MPVRREQLTAGAPVALLGSVALLIAGCGTSNPATYGGMTSDQAHESAVTGIQAQVTDASSDLYRHRVRLLDVTRSHEPGGGAAWRVRFRDAQTGVLLCVWESRSALSGHSFMRECGRSKPAPPQPTQTGSTPAY